MIAWSVLQHSDLDTFGTAHHTGGAGAGEYSTSYASAAPPESEHCEAVAAG